jgi:HAD superfamily hydrolase (TIGR01490 family)
VSQGVAFFDVDGTLTRINGMFRFLKYVLSRQDRAAEYDRAMAEIRALTAAGSAREQTNRLYFRSYAGMRWAELTQLGLEWFAGEELAGREALYNAETIGALRAHQSSGAAVVLVSGSFEPCLAPLAVRLGVSAVLCTRPEVTTDGWLTGIVCQPMIGEAKAAAVRELMAHHGVDPACCFAYGDHLSDLPMLEAVGNPVAVGTDAGLAGQAQRAGWRRLDAR